MLRALVKPTAFQKAHASTVSHISPIRIPEFPMAHESAPKKVCNISVQTACVADTNSYINP